MQNEIKKYPVQHPLLRNYIKFFWELHIEDIQLNHKLIPQRNINLRINLNDSPHYACLNGRINLLEDVYFSGLQDHFQNSYLRFNGKVDVLGVCFYPEGFYPFFNIPLSEFKNQLLGANEVGFKLVENVVERLKEAPDVYVRLAILENELAMIYIKGNRTPEDFRLIFNELKRNNNALMILDYCRQNRVSIRKLERMYSKYIGLSPSSYSILNRFHQSLNQLLYTDFSKLSDLAYDNGYFDQMHFIKDFKRFAGNSPRIFINQEDSILQIGKLT